MNELESQNVDCPYCGEPIELLIDCSVLQQNYIEDCQVCCRPININVSIADDDEISVTVSSEDE
jgi:Cysteine-rich CPXCG